tara:strand:- start:279 stop:446 length:168 start_codon:yes stop_codon:yes gene_type:complete
MTELMVKTLIENIFQRVNIFLKIIKQMWNVYFSKNNILNFVEKIVCILIKKIKIK